jgi:hypothetical protein
MVKRCQSGKLCVRQRHEQRSVLHRVRMMQRPSSRSRPQLGRTSVRVHEAGRVEEAEAGSGMISWGFYLKETFCLGNMAVFNWKRHEEAAAVRR